MYTDIQTCTVCTYLSGLKHMFWYLHFPPKGNVCGLCRFWPLAGRGLSAGSRGSLFGWGLGGTTSGVSGSESTGNDLQWRGEEPKGNKHNSIRMNICTYECVYTTKTICAYVCRYTHMYVRVYVCTYVHTYMSTYAHVYTVYTYVYMHINYACTQHEQYAMRLHKSHCISSIYMQVCNRLQHECIRVKRCNTHCESQWNKHYTSCVTSLELGFHILLWSFSHVSYQSWPWSFIAHHLTGHRRTATLWPLTEPALSLGLCDSGRLSGKWIIMAGINSSWGWNSLG